MMNGFGRNPIDVNWKALLNEASRDPQSVLQVLDHFGWVVTPEAARQIKKAYGQGQIVIHNQLDLSDLSALESAPDFVSAMLAVVFMMQHIHAHVGMQYGAYPIPKELEADNIELLAHAILHGGGIATVYWHVSSTRMITTEDELSRMIESNELYLDESGIDYQTALIRNHYINDDSRLAGIGEHLMLINYYENDSERLIWIPDLQRESDADEPLSGRTAFSNTDLGADHDFESSASVFADFLKDSDLLDDFDGF